MKKVLLSCKQAKPEAAYQQLLSNFPHNTHMADVIHHGIASCYRKNKKDAKANEIDSKRLHICPGCIPKHKAQSGKSGHPPQRALIVCLDFSLYTCAIHRHNY